MYRILFALPSLLLLQLLSCNSSTPSLPPATYGGGFLVETTYEDAGLSAIAPYTELHWVWQHDGIAAAGDPSTFDLETAESGLAYTANARVDAVWNATWVNSPLVPYCNGASGTQTINSQGQLVDVVCIVTGSGGAIGESVPFTFNPDPINTASPPSSVTITGSGFNTTYGMPVLQYFDLNGNLVAQNTATSVSSDYTTVTFTTPNFTELSAGTYAGIINNATSGGGLQYVGVTSVSVPEPFYRPTSYTDSGSAGYGSGWTQTVTPDGPITGGILGSYTTTLRPTMTGRQIRTDICQTSRMRLVSVHGRGSPLMSTQTI